MEKEKHKCGFRNRKNSREAQTESPMRRADSSGITIFLSLDMFYDHCAEN